MKHNTYPQGEEREKALLRVEKMILKFFRKENISKIERSSWAEMKDEMINSFIYPNISIRMFEQCVKVMVKKGLLTKRERKGVRELYNQEPGSISIWLTQKGADQARRYPVYFS